MGSPHKKLWSRAAAQKRTPVPKLLVKGGERERCTRDDICTLLLALPVGHFTSTARVAYCDVLGQGRIGTRLEFVGSSEPLEMSVLATALESLQA